MRDHNEKSTATQSDKARKSIPLQLRDFTLTVTGSSQIEITDQSRGMHALCAFSAGIYTIEDIGNEHIIVTLKTGEQKLLNIKSICWNGQLIPRNFEAGLRPYQTEYSDISPENIRWFAETFGLNIFSRLRSRYIPDMVNYILQNTSHDLVNFLIGIGISPDTITLIMLDNRELLTSRDIDEAKQCLLKAGGIYQSAYLIENVDHQILLGLWYKEDFSEADLKDYKGSKTASESVASLLLYAIRMKRKISCRYGSVCLMLDPVRLMDDTKEGLLLAFDEARSVFSSYPLSGLKEIRILDMEALTPAPSGNGLSRGFCEIV